MPDYGEPWETEGGVSDIVNRHGHQVCHLASFCDDSELALAIACVNACAGIRDPEKVVKSWAEVVRLHSLGMDDKTFGYAVRKLVEANIE